MKGSNLKLLAIVFLALLTIAIYPIISEEFSIPFKSVKSLEPLYNEKPNFDEVSQIEIKTKDQTLNLKRHAEGWKIDDYFADEEKIKKFIEEFNSIKPKKLVSKNSKNFSNFGVDDTIGYFVKIVNKDTFEFVLGNYAPGINSFYVRKNDSEKVYESDGNIRTTVNSTFTDWISKKVFYANKEGINKITVSGPQNWVLTKNSNTKNWQLIKNRKTTNVNSDAINSALENIATANALTILSGNDYETFINEKNKIKLKIEKSDQKEPLEYEFILKELTYLVRPVLPNSKIIYEIPTETLKPLVEITK